ncbi:hypothetical protein LJC42_03750 [Eubacteriales bacterium OttesenSCG-928-K08]|nr:hypothetical protein [Eubacteriales bacterium OttesenSCG-928-K08]
MLLLLCCCLLLCGCTNTAQLDEKYQQGYDAGYEKGLAQGYADGYAVANDEWENAQVEEPDEPDELEQREPELGERLKPAKIGETLTYESAPFWSKGTAWVEVTLLEVIRGDEALEILKKKSSSNVAPDEGYEYVLAKFKVTNVEHTGDEKQPLDVYYFDFDFSTDEFEQYFNSTLVYGLNELSASIFEGASTEGYVPFQCPIGQTGYAVYCTELWFKLE